MYARTLLNWIFPPIRRVEKRLFRDLIGRADAAVAERIAKRVEQINLVQRSTDGQEINLYSWVRGKAFFDPDTALSEWGEGEAVLAEAIYKIDGETVCAKFFLVDGQLCSLNFSACIVRGSNLELQSLDFNSPVPESDLSREARDTVAPQHSKIARKLPRDFVRIAQSNGDAIRDDCTILPTDEQYLVQLDGRSILILAEIHDQGLIGVYEDRTEDEYLFLSYEGERPANVGKEFERAVESIKDQ